MRLCFILSKLLGLAVQVQVDVKCSWYIICVFELVYTYERAVSSSPYGHTAPANILRKKVKSKKSKTHNIYSVVAPL